MDTIITKNGHEHSLSEKTRKVITDLIAEYKGREVKQLINAKIALWGIIACLILCLAIFLLANFLTETKTNKTALTDLHASQNEALFKSNLASILEIRSEQLDLDSAMAAASDSARTRLATDYEKRSRSNQLRLEEKTRENDKLERSLNSGYSSTNLYDFINGSSTRIGAILILVFMVQFLSRIHRYNVKLADFYASRANALSLHLTDAHDLKIEKIISIFSPDGIDIKPSKLPTDQVMDLIKTTLQSVGNK